MRSVTGCLSTGIFTPKAGSRVFGATIATPGSGPATDGLSGSELLMASQPAESTAAHSQAPTAIARCVVFLFILISFTGNLMRTHAYCGPFFAYRHNRSRALENEQHRRWRLAWGANRSAGGPQNTRPDRSSSRFRRV